MLGTDCLFNSIPHKPIKVILASGYSTSAFSQKGQDSRHQTFRVSSHQVRIVRWHAVRKRRPQGWSGKIADSLACAGKDPTAVELYGC